MNFYFVSVMGKDGCVYEKLYRTRRPAYPSIMKRSMDRLVSYLERNEVDVVSATVQEISVPEAIRRFRCDTDFLNPRF